VRFTIGSARRQFEPDAVIIAGYTGRDREKVQHHIDELAALGIAPPPSVPAYWLQPPWLAVQADDVVVVGAQTSGEAELALVGDADELFVTLASDHTDRAAEAIDVELSKAVCPVPVATEAWPVADVDGHWDELVLRSWIADTDGDVADVRYQDDVCASLVAPLDLLSGYPYGRPQRFVMLTGTVAVIGDIRPSTRFRAELHDPLLRRSIHLDYRITSLAAQAASMTETAR
jgi:hypothetical protein